MIQSGLMKAIHIWYAVFGNTISFQMEAGCAQTIRARGAMGTPPIAKP